MDAWQDFKYPYLMSLQLHQKHAMLTWYFCILSKSRDIGCSYFW